MKAAAGLAVLLAVAAAASAAEPPSASPSPGIYTAEDRPQGGVDAALSLHRMNYVVHGGDGLKLQYSFKYRLVDRAGFFIAYTNVMLWEVFEESIPMKDIVFNPEAFYRVKEGREGRRVLDAGFHHLSNGQIGPDSRTLDRLFVRGQHAGSWQTMPWNVTLQVFPAILAKGRQNTDYSDYVGWWDVEIWLRNLLGQRRSGLDLQLQRTSGPGGNPFRGGSAVVGLQYRLVEWERVNPLLYVQWFTGYGEFLIDYHNYVDRWRAGLSWFY